MVDGKILSGINEERFVRKKLAIEFPKNSIDWALKCNALTIDMVDFRMWGMGRYRFNYHI